ncbi:DNA gyrase inhibitor YacG [Azospirillum sp. sgz302134]
MNDNNKPEKACPICGRPATPEARPFCSKRCADVDLSRWLGGVYRIESNDRGDTDATDDAEE